MTDLRPSWTWQFTDAAGHELDRPASPSFTERFDAEEWLGVHWRALRDQGAAGAMLRHAGSAVAPVHDLTAVPERMTFRAED